MQLQQMFAGICPGLHILTYLSYAANQAPAALADIKKQLAYARDNKIAAVVAITSPVQVDCGKFLYKCGFRRKLEFKNPVHGGHLLKLWTITIAEIDWDKLGKVK